MPKLAPISWLKFVNKMKKFGFVGPFQSGKHPYMIKGNLTITIPNHHTGDISSDLLSRILRQASISRDIWIIKR
jgi:predicted RNA binding protein YcfA (HicA-like mRNA interferase family)